MKKYIIGFLVCSFIIVCLGASFDNRQYLRSPVFRLEVPQLTRVSGDANDVDTTVNLNGTIRQITVGVNDNTGDKTVIITLVDDNGSVLFTSPAIAEDTETAPTAHQYMTQSSSTLPMAVLVTGALTIDANLSGDPSTSGMTIDVVLYGD